MGNCFRKIKTTAITNFSDTSSDNKPPSPTVVFLHADSSNDFTHYLRFALSYKPLTLRFLPSETPSSSFTLRFESPSGLTVSGSAQTVLRFVESKFPHPRLLPENAPEDDDVATQIVTGSGSFGQFEIFAVVRRVVELQHKSMTWQVEKVAAWGKEMATRGRKEVVVDGEVDPRLGTAKMEVSKLGKRYEKVLEVLLEHARMEERVIFPILHAADPGVCKCVNEEHARDLPIMNGIKEDIKSIGVMNTGTPIRREALCSLSSRLKTLQEHCRDHFNEEEKNLFPLLEAAELTTWRQKKIVEQCIDMMQETHSHLFRFFIEGLAPHEAIEYLNLIMACVNKERVSSMLRLLVD